MACLGAAHRGAYLFADFACGQIFELLPNGSVSAFVTDDPSIVAMEFGPYVTTQALYYVTQPATGNCAACRAERAVRRPRSPPR